MPHVSTQRHIHQAREQLPPPGSTPHERLIHTVQAFKDLGPDEWASIATSGIYDEGDGARPLAHGRHPRPIHTGITHGDLRAINAQLNTLEAVAAAARKVVELLYNEGYTAVSNLDDALTALDALDEAGA